MANRFSAGGLRPIEYMNGVPWNGKATVYCVPSTDISTYAVGDPVVLAGGGNSNGIPYIRRALPGDSILGAVVSIGNAQYGTLAGFSERIETTVLPGQKSFDYFLFVADDPNLLFEIQESSTAQSHLTPLAIGESFSILLAPPAGRVSGVLLDNSSAKSSQLQIVRLSQIGGNEVGKWAKWVVKILSPAGALTTAQVAAVGALINPPPSGYIATPHGLQIDFTNPSTLTLTSWTGGTGTLTLTREVTLDGRPTLRVDMPAACTEVQLGRTSGVSVPAGWDTPPATTWGCPVYVLDRAPYTNFQIYVGDATYANYILQSYNPNTLPFPWNGWHTPQFRDGWGAMGTELTSPVKVGTLTEGSVAQAKLRVTKSAGTPATFYCSWAGPLPVEQPRILWTADDGSDDWYSFLWPAAKLYGIPFALGFDREFCTVLKTGWCSEAQIAEMAADASGTVELYAHSSNNKSVADLGAAGYLAADDTTWAWLKSLGVRNDRIYHPWVQGLFDADSIAGMKARGLQICRAAYNVADGRVFHPSMCDTGQVLPNMPQSQGRYAAPNGFATLNTTTLAQGKSAIDQTIARGGVLIIMCHRFVDSAPSLYQWLKTDMTALLEYAAAKERAGLLRNIKASELAANIIDAV